MRALSVVLDTNILVAALRSSSGASHRVMRLFADGRFVVNISTAVILEYEAVLKRDVQNSGLSHKDIDALVDYICAVGNRAKISYRWRPVLSDPNDDFLLELAVASNSDFIVTFNSRDFLKLGQFKPKALKPRDFLTKIGG